MDGLAICIPFEQLEQAMNIAKNPQLDNLLTIERKESRPQPLNGFARWLVAEELAPMDAGEAHARKRLRVLDNKIQYVAAITSEGRMHKVYV